MFLFLQIVFLALSFKSSWDTFIQVGIITAIIVVVAIILAVHYKDDTEQEVKLRLFYDELLRVNPIEWRELDLRRGKSFWLTRTASGDQEKKESLEQMKTKYPHLWEAAERRFETLPWWDKRFISGDD